MKPRLRRPALGAASALAIMSLLVACSSSTGGGSATPSGASSRQASGGDLIRVTNALGVTLTTKVPHISTGWSAASNPQLPQPKGLQNNQVPVGQQYNVSFDTPGAGEASTFTLQLIVNGKPVGSVSLEFQNKTADETGFAPSNASAECSWGQAFTYTLPTGASQKADWGGYCHNGNTYIEVMDEEPNPWQ